MKLAVLEENGNPIPGFTLEDSIPLRGDQLFGTVRWKNRQNLEELKGKPVLIEVRVREGELYALRFVHQIQTGEHVRDRQTMMYSR